MPRGGLPLVIAKAIPFDRSAATAATVAGVRTFFELTRVPSTSARTAKIVDGWGACFTMRGLSLLGLDPLYVANEGKLVAVEAPEVADVLLATMRAHPLG